MESKNPYEPPVHPLPKAKVAEKSGDDSRGRTVLNLLLLGVFFLAGALASKFAVEEFAASRFYFYYMNLFYGSAIAMSLCGITYIVGRIFFQMNPASPWIRMLAFLAGVLGPIAGIFIHWYSL